MLYNGIVKFIMQAQYSINKKDIENANRFNIKAQNIISELMYSLDKKYEISGNLFSLYDYMNRRLVEANVDVEILEEV